MLDTMPEIYLYTITILKMDPMSMKLSPKVDAAIEKVTTQIVQQIENFKINT